MNSHTDAGNNIYGAFPVYPGEPEDRAPGRGTEGQLDPSGDSADWYYFSVQAGMTIDASISAFEMELIDSTGETTLASGTSFSATAETTGNYFIRAYTPDGASAGSYDLEVTVSGQNDAGTGGDAGNSMNSAASISPGSYEGYLDSDDWADWYSFDASSGQGIKVDLTVNALKSDFDVHLYNPDGELAHEAMYYGDDTLEYPADMTGTWTMEIDIWPGYDTSKWPDDYFLYGSGPYAFELQVGGSVNDPPAPIPQPDINPIAQTFIINNDPGSNKDEFSYLAAVPAATHLRDGNRYVSPVVYRGEKTPTHWFGTVDDTTGYLLDDWNTYLGRHGMTAEEYVVPGKPVQAAAQIATDKWDSADTAVVAVNGYGNGYEDDVVTVIEEDASLNAQSSVTRKTAGELQDLGGQAAAPLFIGSKWGAVAVRAHGDSFTGEAGVITPRYEAMMEDMWPSPYDVNGPDLDIFYPVTTPGLWLPYTSGTTGMTEMEIIKIAGDRRRVSVSDADCSLKVTVTTEEPSPLRIYLVDPRGTVRRPMVPHWNGGDINPIHIWNGGHWEHNFNEFRRWEPEMSTHHTQEIHYPMEGQWTVIVVPGSVEAAGTTYSYHLDIEMREHAAQRNAAAMSAANGAVLASLHHAPLLYVNGDSVPPETQDALDALGVSTILFVNIGEVSSADVGASTEYTTMQEVVDAIKASQHSENVVTVTSLGSLDGYFAPAAMTAAYHGSPVLNIGESKETYNTLDMLTIWRGYAGDYYHGCNALGHAPKMSEPFVFTEFLTGLLDGDIPTPGFDLHKRWYTAIHDGFMELIEGYGLDREGKEAYLFVAPRDTDIGNPICRALTGIESYAGLIPVETPAFSSAVICRDILYPAIIYANPGRDITSSCFYNFADGSTWNCNDGNAYPAYTSREMKESLSSHGRFYEGHSIWENLLDRYLAGCSVLYHCSHGTGGSGICCMYENLAEQFPYAELRHEELKDFDWWDGWRGYMYDDKQVKTPRWGGFTWSNPREPNLYDIVHFKWVDQLLGNLHSNWNLWQSCTTGEHFGPLIYLEHGAALWYGNAETGVSPLEEVFDIWYTTDFMENGRSIGDALSEYVWLIQRDFTARPGSAEREQSMYGSSSMEAENCQVVYGDPTMTVYSPEWTEPTPVTP